MRMRHFILKFPMSYLVLRFSLSIVALFCMTVVLLFFQEAKHLWKYVVLLVSAAIVLAGSQVWFESKQYSRLRYFLWIVPTMALLALLFQDIHSYEHVTLVLASVSFAVVAPFLFARFNEEHVWSFQFSILKSGVVAMLATCLVMFGVFAISGTLEYLLSIKLYSPQYGSVEKVCWSFLFPVLVLANIPDQFEEFSEVDNNKWLKMLLAYVMIPVLVVFALILHTYGVTILIDQALPKGRIAYLVGAFSLASISVYMLSTPWKEAGIIRLYRRWLGSTLLLPLGLFAVAIYERVSAYGLTSQRYALIALWGWLCIVAVLLIVRSVRVSKWSFALLSVFLFLLSTGPLSILTFPVSVQLWNLKTLIHKVKSDPILNKDAKFSEQVSSALSYVYDENKEKSEAYLTPLLGGESKERFSTAKSVANKLGIKYAFSSGHQNTYGYLYYKSSQESLVDISHYKQMVFNLAVPQNKKVIVGDKEGQCIEVLLTRSNVLELYKRGIKTPFFAQNISKLIQELFEVDQKNRNKRQVVYEVGSVRLQIVEAQGRVFFNKESAPWIEAIKVFIAIK